jgi:alpha-L-fucosidase
LFVNGEAIYGVRPWLRSNEGNIWFTRKRGTDTVFAFLVTDPWVFGERKDFVLTGVAAGPETAVSVLGQNDQVLEYQPDVVPETRWRQAQDGLHISVVRAQRLYNDRTWPNPLVLKITDARPPDH